MALDVVMNSGFGYRNRVGGREGQNEDKFIKIQNSNPKFQTNYNDRNSNLQTSLIKSFGH